MGLRLRKTPARSSHRLRLLSETGVVSTGVRKEPPSGLAIQTPKENVRATLEAITCDCHSSWRPDSTGRECPRGRIAAGPHPWTAHLASCLTCDWHPECTATMETFHTSAGEEPCGEGATGPNSSSLCPPTARGQRSRRASAPWPDQSPHLQHGAWPPPSSSLPLGGHPAL